MIYAVSSDVFQKGIFQQKQGAIERISLPSVRGEGWDELQYYVNYFRVNNVKSVVVLPLMGIMELDNYFGTELLASLVEKANQMEDVSAIVLKANSPGGNANSWRGLADAIFKSKKPVVAHVVNACSAAMPVVASCDEVFIEPTVMASMGSIGSYYIHCYEQDPDTTITIIRSKEDKGRPWSLEPIDEESSAAMLALCKASDKEMSNAIKRGRGAKVNPAVYNTARIIYMEEAITLGLADQKGSISDAILRANQLAQNV